MASDGGPTRTLLQWGVDEPDEIGGGLNNMIMTITQADPNPNPRPSP